MPPDDRSPIAIGMGWASMIMAVSAQMIAPPLVGYWIDQRLGTKLVFLLAGVLLGVAMGTMGMLRIVKSEKGFVAHGRRPRSGGKRQGDDQ
jgi:F0F1-type ATP synthase assembly protein I